MLQSLDYALIGVVADKRRGTDFGHQLIRSLSILGTVDKVSSVYQFKPLSLKVKVQGELGMTHIAFSILLQLKDIEDWGTDFGRQIEKFSAQVAQMTNIKNYEVRVLDFRSQFTLSASFSLPYPEWLERDEFLYTSLEIAPEDYIHPVHQKSLKEILRDEEASWEDSAFLKSGKTLLD